MSTTLWLPKRREEWRKSVQDYELMQGIDRCQPPSTPPSPSFSRRVAKLLRIEPAILTDSEALQVTCAIDGHDPIVDLTAMFPFQSVSL